MRLWGRQPKPSLVTARQLFDASVVDSQQGRLGVARKKLLDALEIYLALEPDYAAVAGAARTLWRLSVVRSAIDSPAAAAADAAESAQRWERLLAGRGTDDRNVVRELTRCYTDLSMLQLQAGDEQPATASGRRAVELGERLVREGHREGKTELGTARHNLAVVLHARGDVAAADKEVAAAVVLRRQLAEAGTHPSLADWELANSLVLSAKIYRARGKARFAATALTRAMELAATLGAAGSSVVAQTTQEMRLLAAEHPGVFEGLSVRIDPGGPR
jgi:tetratricopeptide (TPR) repeat protein